MLTLTATSSCSVVQRAAVAPAETAAAKGRQQYPAEALLTIFWYYRLEVENTCYSFPEAATVLLYAIYFSVLSWFSFKYPQLWRIQQLLLRAWSILLQILLLGHFF